MAATAPTRASLDRRLTSRPIVPGRAHGVLCLPGLDPVERVMELERCGPFAAQWSSVDAHRSRRMGSSLETP